MPVLDGAASTATPPVLAGQPRTSDPLLRCMAYTWPPWSPTSTAGPPPSRVATVGDDSAITPLGPFGIHWLHWREMVGVAEAGAAPVARLAPTVPAIVAADRTKGRTRLLITIGFIDRLVASPECPAPW